MKKYLPSLALMLCTALPLKATVVHVKGTRSVAFGELKKSHRLHTNRDYTLVNIPKELQGLQYTLHQHKAAASLTVKTEKPGVVYLCLWEGVTPTTLKLQGKWEVAGKVNAFALGREYPAAIHKTRVAAGQELTIPSADRWGSVLLADQIKGLPPFTPEKGPTSSTRAASSDPKQGGEFGELQRRLADSRRWNMARLEKEALRKDALVIDSDKTPVDIVLRRTAALLEDLQGMRPPPQLETEASELGDLGKQNVPGLSTEEQVALFNRVAGLRRRIAFRNPLLDFNRIAFIKHHKSTYNHMCDQYYGHFARQGGGVFVLEDPFGERPVVRDLLSESTVVSGRLKGQKLDKGSFISLELDYDARTVLFGWTEGSKAKWTPEGTFHVFKCNADGSDLTQLTDGPWNEFDPCVLPNGRIVFVSERCGGFLRCGRHCPTYRMYGMMPDGSDIIPISFHDTHEWHPSVDNDGMIAYTRWDYVDRDSDIAHHIWHCFPDGRDPRSYHGNYPLSRESRPWMEMAIRAIPGSPNYVAVATAHHGQNYGSMVLIDLRKEDDRSMSQLQRITPETHLPESETAPGTAGVSKGGVRKAEVYATPWPLSEDYYLCVYDSRAANHGIYLVDSFGNRELLYRDPSIPCLDPIPFKPRKRPPVIPVQTIHAKADRKGGEDLSMSTVTVMDIYEGELPWPEGTRIEELRIINLFPKSTPPADKPNIGHAAQSLARGVLGTVPVEADGSVHFKMPTGMAVYFQALDENGLCVQSMRSGTFTHPGETLSCIGCHERKNEPPKNVGKTPIAMKRPPSMIKPEVEGSYPLTFARLVQPVLNARCLECHERNKNKKAPGLRGDVYGAYGWSEAFHSLQKLAWGRSGGNGALHRRNGNRSFSIPGKDGARVSKLYAHLTKKGGHHDLKLTPEEMRRITLWIDCNSNFYGAYLETDRQAKGEVVKPELGLSPWMDFEALVR